MSHAVLLSCHGTVTDTADIPAFLSNIRRGRPAPTDLVEEVTRRYELIGGSPLMQGSNAQAAALEARLGMPVRVAGRLWHPYPDVLLRELAALGARRVLSLPLAPQSVAVYNAAVVAAAASSVPDVQIVESPPYGLEPALIDAFVETIDEGLKRSFAQSGVDAFVDAGAIPIVLTAHSLPLRVVQGGDTYESEFRAMAQQVADRMRERGHPVEIAFQSQGASNEPWLGPDLGATFAKLGSGGYVRALVAPIGFVAEHVETLFDLDIDAPELARRHGISALGRAPTVNDRARFIDALEAVARRALGL